MSKKNLVICDHEFRYANNLMENISERKDLAVKVYTCTTWDKVDSFSKKKKIHILLVDEQYPSEQRKKIEAGQTFVLTSGVCKDLEDSEKAIYKYQCVDQILAEIFETYCEKTKEEIFQVVKKGQQKIIAVYSPIHRVGKTTFALALGKELAKREEVLYLNMEEYAGFGERFAREESKNLGDILYYLKQENSNLGLRLGAMVKQQEGLDYIPPIPVCADLKEITPEEWKLLFQQIMEHSVYEVLILDLGESIQGLFQILYLCDRIYMPVLEDQVSEEKLLQYEENLSKLGMESLKEKTTRFVIPQDIESYVKNLVREER